MRDPSTPLLRDRTLRAALRQLYPEVPTFVRRALVLAPDTPLPLPAMVHSPLWGNIQAARTELQHTLTRLLQADPTKAWAVYESGKPWARVHVITCNGVPLRQLPASSPGGICLVATDADSVTDIKTLHGTRETTWTRFLHHTTMSMHIDGLYVRLTYAHTNHAQYDVMRVVDCGGYLPLADGSAPDLPENPEMSHELPRHLYEHARHELVRRWRQVPDTHDRTRIAQHWLGHPHPVLAAAGLEAMSALSAGQPLRSARP